MKYMKYLQNIKTLIKVYLIALVAAFSINLISAQTVSNCQNAFGPRFICERYADITNNFTFGTFITLALSVAIAILILWVLVQIFRSGFTWVNKSSDEKARTGALKSMINAIFGKLITLVALVTVLILAQVLGIGGTPNLLYACFDKGAASWSAANIDPDTGTPIDTKATPSLTNVNVYEETPAKIGSTTGNLYNDTERITSSIIKDQNLVKTMNESLICKDVNTGKEYTNDYIILKSIGIKK